MGDTAKRLGSVSERKVRGEKSALSDTETPSPPLRSGGPGPVRSPAWAADPALAPIDADALARDPADVAPDLLGRYLIRLVGGETMAVRLVEVEAYRGPLDPGSHAYRGPTARNRVMFGPVGRAYVYFTYGNHHMLNVVCHPPGMPGAVLLRGAEPVWGVEAMARLRRSGRRVAAAPAAGPDAVARARFVRWLLAGPARLAAALGVDGADYGREMVAPWPEGCERAFLLTRGEPPAPSRIATSGRIGLSRGAELRLRFYLPDSPGVSPARPTHP